MGQYEIGHPQSKSKDLAMRPLLGDKPAIAATGLALIKRPLLLKLLLRLAGLDKTAIAFDKTPTAAGRP